MIREYFVRGQRKTVEEIDNVIAIKATLNERGEPRASMSSFGTAAHVAEAGLPRDTLAAFEKARWLFVVPSPETTRALAAREPVANAEETGKLVRRPNGRFGIVTRRLNVQLHPDIPAEQTEQILTTRGLRILTPLRFAPNLFEVDTLAHADALAASVDLSTDARFILAEPMLIEHVPARLTPTDPRFHDQWQWANTGANGGTAGADVRAELAWNETRGAGIRVAVIDNGFNAAHEDLQAGIVGTSGFFQQVGANPPAFVQGTAGMPMSDHGTFCAGMVGARQNNGRGGCGAAPECGLMLIACLGDQVGTQTTLARAVAYAANPAMEIAGADPATGADILVSSLGPNGADWDLTVTLQLAIEGAAANGRGGLGMAIFWAASNGNNVDVMQDEVVSHADVIAVVRSTRMDLEDNAARGARVELIAPGVDVLSTTGAGGYGASTGTSFAAPCAAGCAALALSMDPRLTRDELRQIMRDTADKIGGVVYDANGHNDDYGFGRVNAVRAVLRAAGPDRLQWSLVSQSAGFGNLLDGQHPIWIADFTGAGRAQVMCYYSGDGNWWLADMVGGQLQWSLVSQSAGFGNLLDGQHPIWIADFTGAGRAQVMCYYSGDGNWWLADMVGGQLQWSLVSQSAGFGNLLDGQHPIWIADFTGAGRAQVMCYYSGDGNWWLADMVGGQLQWSLVSQSAGFGNLLDGQHPIWIADFTGAGRAQVMCYYSGDGNWWLADMVGGQLQWSLVSQSAGFGNLLDGQHPIWIADFTGAGRAQVMCYYSGDGNWWLADMVGGQLQWSLVSQSAGFGNLLDGQHPIWIADFTGAGRAQVMCYYSGDGNWWLADMVGGQLQWSLVSQSAGFGNLLDGQHSIWIADLAGVGRAQVVLYYRGDGHWWLGDNASGQLQWSLVSRSGGFGDLLDGQHPVWMADFTGVGHAQPMVYYSGDGHWWLGSMQPAA